jgi:hypothetical protein
MCCGQVIAACKYMEVCKLDKNNTTSRNVDIEFIAHDAALTCFFIGELFEYNNQYIT